MNSPWPDWRDFLISINTGTKPDVEGGLRVSGIFKQDRPDEPLVSYVTVVRNNDLTLARTIESVLAQSYSNVEHIVLDGKSTDSTLKVIESYSDKIDYYVSEADSGLYDALNKAIPLARGRFISVLNSDDWLEPDAAECIVRESNDLPSKALILSAACVDTGNSTIQWQPSRIEHSSHFTGANCCHNAIYATRSAYEASGPYDIAYKIASDFKWIMQCFEAGVLFNYMDQPTVNYSLGGISSDGKQHRLECQRLIHERFSFLEPNEVKNLHYCYYLWRERVLKNEVEAGFDAAHFVRDIRNKYSNQPDFLLAADQSGLACIGLIRKLKIFIRSCLIEYPRTYSFVYWLYCIIVGKKIVTTSKSCR